MRNVQISVHIDFPAFAAFVEYLRDGEQKTIDSIAVTVDTATSSLGQMLTGLKGSVDANK